jgi:pyruvate formate lyase activating enzyme
MRDLIRERNLETEVWIRTPLIPGMTDTGENIYAIGDLLAQEFPEMVSRWELLGFNNMCTGKYRKLGLSWPLAEAELLSAGQTEHLLEIARKAGKGLREISFSGLTRRE